MINTPRYDDDTILTEKISNGNTLTYKTRNNTAYHVNTSPEVVEWLERARLSGARVRLFYGDTNTPDFEKVHGKRPEVGRDWGEEYDVTGTIGRSTGKYRIPLVIANSRSTGGPSILDDCIVRLIVGGREVYRHTSYHQPDYTIGKPPEKIGKVDMKQDGYTTGVYADGDNVANFKNEKSARKWIDFMTGKRMSK